MTAIFFIKTAHWF